MSTPVDIFDFIIAPIRDADAREGGDFLYRYFRGHQHVWEQTDQNIRGIPKLWSIDDCPDEYLQYLKNIVGWTSEYDSFIELLSDEELRRLISISARLWKERGPEDVLIDVLYFATAARSRYWNWFDFRWVLAAAGPPDSLWWGGTAQFVFFIETLAGTARRDGMLWEVTALETGVTAQGQMLWHPSVGNYVPIFNALGYPGYPSADPEQYHIRQVVRQGTELGEEHEGRDPWIVDLPDPTVAGAEYESNLRIVDNGTLNRDLVRRIMRLMRPSGERWEITYLALLDQFIIDGDNTQWDVSGTSRGIVEDGVLKLGTVGDILDEATCLVPSAVWSQAMIACRARITSAPAPLTAFGLRFHWTDSNNYYLLGVSFEGTSAGSVLTLARLKAGVPALLIQQDMTTDPIYPDVFYTFRVTIVNEGANKRIKVFMDGVEFIDYLDTDPLAQGTLNLLAQYAEVEIDEVEVIELPGESDYIDINS